MGWGFTKDASKADIVKRCLSGGAKPVGYFRVKSTQVGNCLWVVFEKEGGAREDRFIALYLLESQKGFGWGYKAMDEGCGLCYYSCPERFLDITPLPASPYAENWRKKVREYHANRLNRGQQASTAEFQEADRDRPACLAHFSPLPCPLCAIDAGTRKAQRTRAQGSIPTREHVRSTYGVDPMNCGEYLMEHVDIVLLNADGKCSCCGIGHKLAGKQVV